MAVDPSFARGDDARRYRFLVGVTLAALEDDLNQVVTADPSLAVVQVFYAAGTGYVALVERRPRHHEAAPRIAETRRDQEETAKTAEKARKKR